MYSDNRWNLVTAGRVYPNVPLVKPDSYKNLNDGEALPLTRVAIAQIARKLAKRQSD